MKSFRTEIENPEVEQDILDLERKIKLFQDGKLDEEKFRSLRLARGVYGQRQQGVQMIRIKIPYGKLTADQMRRIAHVADEYSNGNLHTTTRQDIQIHYVSLDRTPELWAQLERDDVTLREACGNTVRNITASSIAGIDPDELFDVTPYADAVFKYFLRNPVNQELGRKFKIAFSSSDKDSAFTFMHDLGFIPRAKRKGKKVKRGFKVVLGGGLGSRPVLAEKAYEFLEEDQLIPFIESILRVFDRYGERARRNRARMKFLLQEIGIKNILKLAEDERRGLKVRNFRVNTNAFQKPEIPTLKKIPEVIIDKKKFETWRASNVFDQKQPGYYAINIKLQTGDIDTTTFRNLADLVEGYACNDLRVTVNQGLMLRFVRKEYLQYFYSILSKLGLAKPGFDSTADITTCPGTDTCNLGISSSMGITRELEKMLEEEYPDLILNKEIKIKISGCMNSCGQHSLANIGMHGSTIRVGKLVVPAMLFLIGGGILGAGEGRFSEKLIKIPSKKAPDGLRLILDDFNENKKAGEKFNSYYDRRGKGYFNKMLLPLADVSKLTNSDFIDWGHNVPFETAIGVGECAGVTIDLVATLLLESEEKLEAASETLTSGSYADSIYHSYSAMINTAKSALIAEGIPTSSQAGIIKDFDEHFVENGKITLNSTFLGLVDQKKQVEPSKVFAKHYLENAKMLFRKITVKRKKETVDAK